MDDIAEWQEMLAEMRAGPVEVSMPQRGVRERLVELATLNARRLEAASSQRQTLADDNASALGELTEGAGVGPAAAPHRVLRHLESAGRLCGGVNGCVRRRAAAELELPTLQDQGRRGQDDYAMLAEVIERRLGAAAGGNSKFIPLPGLMLIDGGKGQLNSVAHARHARAGR